MENKVLESQNLENTKEKNKNNLENRISFYLNKFTSIFNINKETKKQEEKANNNSMGNLTSISPRFIKSQSSLNFFPPYSLKEWSVLFSTNSLESINRPRLINSLKIGIDKSIRGKVWMYLSKSFDSYKKNKKSPISYENLLQGTNKEAEKMIKKDINRTFLNIDKFTIINVNTNKLYNILKAYSVYDEKVGYCQGMNSLVATILECINKEEYCYWTLRNMMELNSWREFYFSNTPRLIRMIEILKNNIKENLGDLYAHFNEVKFEENLGILMTHYFLTVFTYKSPLQFSIRIIDLFWVYEEKIIFDTIINMLYLVQERLKKMTFDELLVYFNNDIIYDIIEEYGIDYIINMV